MRDADGAVALRAWEKKFERVGCRPTAGYKSD
jgi:hypothetical protein